MRDAVAVQVRQAVQHLSRHGRRLALGHGSLPIKAPPQASPVHVLEENVEVVVHLLSRVVRCGRSIRSAFDWYVCAIRFRGARRGLEGRGGKGRGGSVSPIPVRVARELQGARGGCSSSCTP